MSAINSRDETVKGLKNFIISFAIITSAPPETAFIAISL